MKGVNRRYPLSNQRLPRHNYSIIVRINKLARLEGNAAKRNGDAHFSHAFAHAFQRNGCQSLHAQIKLGQRIHIAHAAINDDTGPGILDSAVTDQVAQQRAAQGATAGFP